jgi:hypothetical protein
MLPLRASPFNGRSASFTGEASGLNSRHAHLPAADKGIPVTQAWKYQQDNFTWTK